MAAMAAVLLLLLLGSGAGADETPPDNTMQLDPESYRPLDDRIYYGTMTCVRLGGGHGEGASCLGCNHTESNGS